MTVFTLRVDYDARGNTPFGMIRDEVELEETWPLYKAVPLVADWRPMSVTLHKAKRDAEFVYFTAGGWAVRPAARRLLEPVLGDSAEFLPLACDTGDEFFAFHPLQLAELGPDADAHRNGVSGNITHIRRYSFEPAELANKSCFRVQHPHDSAAGSNSGGSEILISDKVRKFIEQEKFRGVRCIPVFTVDFEP